MGLYAGGAFFYILLCALNRTVNLFTNYLIFERQHPTKQQQYAHLVPMTKTIKIRRTRHAGHCRRSRDEIISDVLLWTPTHGRAKTGRPARTYIQQLYADTGCIPEDLPEEIDDKEGSRERVRDIRADGVTWWWWWWWLLYLRLM